MTPRQVQLIRDSFTQVQAHGPEFVDRFYDRLFEIAPDARSLFGSDLQAQKGKLFAALKLVVHGLDRFDALRPVLSDLGQRHRTYGVVWEDYGLVGEALVHALGQVLGDRLDAATEDAWYLGYTAISDAMNA
jgi:hemoglobin-like flavoprotein